MPGRGAVDRGRVVVGRRRVGLFVGFDLPNLAAGVRQRPRSSPGRRQEARSIWPRARLSNSSTDSGIAAGSLWQCALAALRSWLRPNPRAISALFVRISSGPRARSDAARWHRCRARSTPESESCIAGRHAAPSRAPVLAEASRYLPCRASRSVARPGETYLAMASMTRSRSVGWGSLRASTIGD